MAEITTIQLSKDVVEKLKGAKEYPRQTYDELIEQVISVFITLKKRDAYDKFLHEIQKAKMKELWGNKEDEAWENV